MSGLKLRSQGAQGGGWNTRDRSKAGELMRRVTHWPPPRAATGEGTGVPIGALPSGSPPPLSPRPLITPEAKTRGGAVSAGSGAHPTHGINNNVIKSLPERPSGWETGAAGR